VCACCECECEWVVSVLVSLVRVLRLVAVSSLSRVSSRPIESSSFHLYVTISTNHVFSRWMQGCCPHAKNHRFFDEEAQFVRWCAI
jgi:hypothetical protein